MRPYLDIVQHILAEGERKENRTGVDALTVAGAMFEHDMARGFPLLTTKKMPFKLVKTELEFFLNGHTDKKWLQERGNTIWDEWANPKKAPYGHDEGAKRRMAEERDLGPIYGWQWRNWGGVYEDHDRCSLVRGIDQLARVVETLKKNPGDRRMIVSAWNPSMMDRMALPPCHYAFQVTVVNGKLNLLWNQRSVDTMLGLPFNIASYALLLHLLAKESGFAEGKLIGFLGDVHIYVNHVEGAKEQVVRDAGKYALPKVVTEPFTSIFDWTHAQSRLEGYESHPRIEFPIAV